MVVPVANAADVIIFATSSHPLAASSAVLEVRFFTNGTKMLK
jgi:hypothetical protein